jgi:hypothetical protein
MIAESPTIRAAALQASHDAGYTDQPFPICRAFRHGFEMGAKGGVPRNLEWGRANYPEETRAFERGYASGIAQTDAELRRIGEGR